MSSETPEKTEDLKAIKKSATATLGVSISLTLVWLFIYNIVSYEMNPLLAFFKILDGINEIVVGMLTVVVIGIGIVVVFTITNLFTQTMTNLYSMRMIEDLIREHLFKGEYRMFVYKLVHFDELPKPASPFPRYVSSALMAFAYYYAVSWFYLVVFSECLYFAAWSAGVQLPFYPENMHIIPMFAIAVPFTARLMAYMKYPYAQDYASFIPGILFVVVLLLAFSGYMGGNFQFLMADIYKTEEVNFFAKGALFWKFLKDGVMIAFYPVFGEVIFYYLMYQDLQEQEDEEFEGEMVLENEALEESRIEEDQNQSSS
ncbi:MAG: hypothetical protein VX278_03985 [Myxococcota bacterium]|nr:hypothetical protein [Myxococcota bacterium]